MPFKRHEGIVAVHPVPIVGDSNQAASARIQFHRDPSGPSIDGIFNQLLDDAGWSFNDLTCRYLIGDVIWQQADALHDNHIK